MLYPQSNPLRQSMDLSGFWGFRFDPDEAGEAAGWPNGFPSGRPTPPSPPVGTIRSNCGGRSI